MAHYVEVFVPLEAGGWRGLFPDVPACEATGSSLDLAVLHAASLLTQHAGRLHDKAAEGLARPRDLAAIKCDGEWASIHAIDWSRAVITMIAVSR